LSRRKWFNPRLRSDAATAQTGLDGFWYNGNLNERAAAVVNR